jgi:hypothetical protein
MPHGPDETVGVRDVSEQPANDEDAFERHERERRESLREERRLLRWEVACLVLVVAFVVVRQLWLT